MVSRWGKLKAQMGPALQMLPGRTPEPVRQPVVREPPPPPKIYEPTPPRKSTKANMAGDVAQCSTLLREMYALDLVIHAMEKNITDDIPLRVEKQAKANAIFVEIRRIVGSWRASSGSHWTREETQFIEEIYKVVEAHKDRGYPEELYD